MLVDRLVFLTPIDGQTQSMPEHTECVLVFLDQIKTGLDEIWARDQAGGFLSHLRGCGLEFQSFFIGRTRITTNVKIVLDTPFGRKPIVIPTHRIEDVHTDHALVTHDDIRLCIGEDVPDMEGTRGRRRGCIHDKGLIARARGVVVIDTIALPDGIPPRLDFECIEMFGQSCRIDRLDSRPQGRSAWGLGLAHLLSR